jgi:hypothetical protein
MKKILTAVLVLLTTISFSQVEDDTDFDSVKPIYFLDSIYLKYNITKHTMSRDIISDIDWMSDMLYENVDIRIATDEDLSMLLSDSIARLFNASQEFNSKRQLRTIYNFIDRTAIDSSLNVLYVRVMSPCQPCMNSIIENIMAETEFTKFLSSHRLKYVYVNYFQTTRNSRYEYIVITAKHWFRRKQIYTFYNEKL